MKGKHYKRVISVNDKKGCVQYMPQKSDPARVVYITYIRTEK